MASQNAKKPVYQLRLKISRSISDIEDWLDDNCNGRYTYNLEGIVETDSLFNKLELLFAFEEGDDRQRFKDAIKSGVF